MKKILPDKWTMPSFVDGSQCPSLPINIPPSQMLTLTLFLVPRPLYPHNNVYSASNPLPDVPSSDPGPTQGFDWIMCQAHLSKWALLPRNDDALDAGGPRRMSVSLDSGVNAVYEWEDNFLTPHQSKRP
jgi:hypothetical protein